MLETVVKCAVSMLAEKMCDLKPSLAQKAAGVHGAVALALALAAAAAAPAAAGGVVVVVVVVLLLLLLL